LRRQRGDGRTPYAVAELNGNRAVAEWLLAQGASTELSEVDRLGRRVQSWRSPRRPTRCSRAIRAYASTSATTTTSRFTRRLSAGTSERSKTMLACGFDPNRPDAGIGRRRCIRPRWRDGLTRSGSYSRTGRRCTCANREFKGQPLIWAAEGSRQQREGRDFAAVGKLLLDAGSPVDWATPDEPAEGILEIVAGWRRA